jgi:hypothetical protein
MSETTLNPWVTWNSVRESVIAARERTGDQRISTTVEDGFFAVQLLELFGDAAPITLAARLTGASAIAFLGYLSAEHIAVVTS